jgi:chemotaxis protein methyltransferase WspC
VTTLAQLEIERLLSGRIGLDAESVGSRAIAAAIAARMAALRITEMPLYLEAIAARPQELAALVEEVVVPETWFLRDRVPFTHLATLARARAARRQKFRVLSVPCSTGEEAYSVAIALLDAGLTPADFEIDAADVSERAIETARRGVYSGASFRGDDLRFRDHHFVRVPGGAYEVLPPLRESVRFRAGNLLELETEPGKRYHAILCRNLIIYLTAGARAAALERLEGLLDEGGALVLGHAENLRGAEGRFRAAEVAGSFTYLKTTVRPRPGTAPPPMKPRLTPARGMKPVAPAPPRNALTPTEAPREERDHLADAAALADRGELTDAAELVQLHLSRKADDPAAHALLGTIRRAAGRLEEAEEHYSRALYCDPGHYESLVQLALLRERRGDRAGAENLRRRAAKARGGPR